MRWAEMSGLGRARIVALVVLTLAILAGAWMLFHKAGRWGHLAALPEDYERFQTTRFEVFHPPELRERAERVTRAGEAFMERAATAFSPHLGDLTPPDSPVRLTLFGTHDEFASFASSALAEDLSHNGGYFDVQGLEIVVVLSEVSDDDLGIRHEVAHLLVARGGGRRGTPMPVWLNEGLATWLETADPARPDAPVPVADWVRVVAAVTIDPPAVHEIMSTDEDAFSAVGNDVAYAYANLLVHFLISRDAEAFWRYARAAREGRALPLEELGNPEALEADWRRFVSEARSRYDTARSRGEG